MTALPNHFPSPAARAAAAAALREQLAQLMAALFASGRLDEQFQQLQMLQDDGSPGFVGEVITLYFADAERIVADLANLLEQPVVDYVKVDAHVHQLKGSSSSVGAAKVRNGCVLFRQFCQENNRNGCVMALNMVRNEFVEVQEKLQTMIQLEQQIHAYENQA